MMSYELLIQSISKYVPLTDGDLRLLRNSFKEKKLKKKHFLFQEGENPQYSTFVNSGCLRSYSIDKNGAEHIVQFAPAGWWISDMKNFLYAHPTTLNVDAVEDSEMLLIKHAEMDVLYNQIPKLNKFFRILSERALATFQQRLVDSLSLTAAERYGNFCKTYPSLIQNLPQKYVASYIGITPEFLSKMLSQPMKKV